jgi:2-methylaconitate cis-trans-isomerase PrpF
MIPMVDTTSNSGPRWRNNVLEYPLHHMRGGTSTGLVLCAQRVPREPGLRDELLRQLLGTPMSGQVSGNRQTTGLGRGVATSNKIFIADMEEHAGRSRIVSTLAQLATGHADIDWNVNCGNMSSALQLWAIDTGRTVGSRTIGVHEIDIRNTNTSTITRSRMTRQRCGRFAVAEIPGVLGAFPAVDLFLQDPVGSNTGRLLPTGAATDVVAGLRVSCVDVAVPMVIVLAADVGKTAHEPINELEADTELMTVLRRIWVAAGVKMGLRRHDGTPMSVEDLARSETIPKICIVGAPRNGGDISARYFTPQTGHTSMAVSGACCLAAATLIPRSIAHGVAKAAAPSGHSVTEVEIGIENPAGILTTTMVVKQESGVPIILSAAYRRSAQILVRGHMPLYTASPALTRALDDLSDYPENAFA